MTIAGTIKRAIMSTPPKERTKVVEGIFAINKPQWASSAGVLRDLQEHFAKSSLFKPWLESTRRDMIVSGAKPKLIDRLKVKLGHGGTLDPMATGVLIVGVGKGTKSLQRFLECTKTYECVVLFGAATDSYDAVGKVVSKAPYDHVTKELVEEKLAQFRGKIMQKPSVFSALKVDGKKMYEYAREGKDIPEVAARPVEVLEMEMVEWMASGSHDFAWPKEEADGADREGAEKLLGIRKEDAASHAVTAARRGRKRSRTPETDHVENAGDQPKRPRTDSEPAMSGALPSEDTPAESTTKPEIGDTNDIPVPMEETPAQPEDASETKAGETPAAEDAACQTQPPAARLRMTVTSGFYVRSLCHDLGLACSSLGIMSSLIRSRQGNYTLGDNVVDFADLEKGPEVWEPQIEKQLEAFMEKEGWEATEIEDEETWKASKKELLAQRRDNDRDRSYQGGGKNKWKGGRNNNYYSKNMNGRKDNYKRENRRDD
ncbi:pseudouridine synthase [Paraphoma chrysanthemicola]|nr:pseudouridine synthase [Paraphoma chrysanthemicola]